MSDNTFDLIYSCNDYEVHYFFDGPEGVTDEEFQKLCKSLLPQAGYKAALKHMSSQNGGWIVWSDVVESLVSLLEQQGYQRVYIDTFHLDAGTIIGLYELDPTDERLGFASQLIVKYNKEVEAKLAKERESKRSLRGLLRKKKTIQIIK